MKKRKIFDEISSFVLFSFMLLFRNKASASQWEALDSVCFDFSVFRTFTSRLTGTSKDIFLMNVLQINSAKGFVAITVRYTKVTKLNTDDIQSILNIFKHIKIALYSIFCNKDRSKVSKP